MKEEFLHYLWRTKQLDWQDLKTTEGTSLTIVKVGQYNTDAGPDFLQARLYLGETLWAGNIEMHLKASDWEKHQHHKDAAYDNVILHVVYEADKVIFDKNKNPIPCLALKERIPPSILNRYNSLLDNELWIPCEQNLHGVRDITIQAWLSRMVVERLERKTKFIADSLLKNNNDWEEVCYQLLAKYLGGKVNGETLYRLASHTPYIVLAKHRNQLFQLEAILLGQAGLLEETFEEDYPKALKEEYNFLQKKHTLVPLQKLEWKFLRMRPASFPTLRIAQLAKIIHTSHGLFSSIIEAHKNADIRTLLGVELGEFWQTHYTLTKATSPKKKTLGKSTLDTIIINAIVPLLFHYGQSLDIESAKDKAMNLLESIPPETNSIIKGWKLLGITAKNAFDTQGLLQLKNEYCQAQKCLTCAIGNAILNQSKNAT